MYFHWTMNAIIRPSEFSVMMEVSMIITKIIMIFWMKVKIILRENESERMRKICGLWDYFDVKSLLIQVWLSENHRLLEYENRRRSHKVDFLNIRLLVWHWFCSGLVSQRFQQVGMLWSKIKLHFSVYCTMDEWDKWRSVRYGLLSHEAPVECDKSPYRTLLHLSHESTCGIFFIPR